MSSRNPALKTKNKPLNEKEMIFVERYLTHFNAAKAAKEAGYCLESPTHQRLAGYELANKGYIRRAIDDRIKMLCMETNEALGRLAAIARGDILDFMSKDPETGLWFIDLDKAEKSGLSYLIKSYTVTREGPQLELYSATEALNTICKHLNILKQPDTEINVSLSAWATFVQKAKQEVETGTPQLPMSNDVIEASFIETPVFESEEIEDNG
jgi:hypothetical protein